MWCFEINLTIFEPELSLTNLLRMKKTLTIIGIFISSISICLAQESDYKLGNYVNPDFKRKALDFSLNSAGYFNSTTNSKTNSIGGGLRLDYDLISNSVKEQAHTFGYISGSGTSDDQDYRKNQGAGTQLFFAREAFQFIKNKTFFEISPRVNADYQYSKLNDNSYYYNNYYDSSGEFGTYYNKENNFQSVVTVKLGIGKGRIENVGDARQAMFIIQELQKKNLLKRTLSNDEVNALTEQITLVKNKRYYDYRVQLIDEISKVDSFLVANDFVEKANSALYFTTLYDKWVYGDRDRREAGSYVKGGISPEYMFEEEILDWSFVGDRYTDIGGYHTINSYYGAAAYIDYRYEKPLSLAWQSSFNAGVSSGLYRYRGFDENSYRTNVDVSYKLGYYPNTRTYVSGAVSQIIRWSSQMYHNSDADYNYSDKRRHAFIRSSNLSAQAYYFLSPQLRLFGQCNFSLAYYDYGADFEPRKDKYPATSFQIGLTYAIF